MTEIILELVSIDHLKKGTSAALSINLVARSTVFVST